jgi:tartrate-resistant acid phosphatase type 5
MRRSSIAIAWLLAGCPEDDNDTAASGTAGAESSSSAAVDSGGTAATSVSASGAPTSDASATAGSTAADDTGASESTGPAVPEGGEVRFVALGDAGEGNEAQFAVAAAIGGVCAERGCDFALYLGDNFYDNGVTSDMDAQFEEKFELPYAALDFPFYVALGNHDYGQFMNMWDQSQYEIAYSAISRKWTMPSEFYSFQDEHVHFIALDTSRILGNQDPEDQAQFIQQDLAGLSTTWTIMFGHHPYISNGPHGNAGNYEGLGSFIFLGGQNVKEFFEANVCGNANVYIGGHDHDRQWLVQTCDGTEFIVSGGGSKLTDFEHRENNPVHFEDDQIEGFLWVEIIDDSFTGVFYDRDGNLSYERTITL